MAYDISSITSGVVDRPPRIVLHGVEKVGKSTFACDFPNAIVLPIKGEEGIDALDVASFPVINDYASTIEALNTLVTGEHDFKTVVIDSISALETLVWAYTCQQNGWDDIEKAGYGKGYISAQIHWQSFLSWCDALRDRGMTVILIGHVAVRTFNDPILEPYDVYELDMNKRAAGLIKKWADCILFANRKILITQKDVGMNQKKAIATGGDKPMLYTQKRAAHSGGGRGIYGRLTYEMPLKYESFADAVSALKGDK